jgi:hypothetical protein
MTDRVQEELELLRTAYPDLEYRSEGGSHWVRISAYPLPEGTWDRTEVEVAFQIPSQAGQAPYAFFVQPALQLAGGRIPNNYTTPATTPWGSEWAQFSWSPVSWMPKADVRAGSNMLNFARSIGDRLREGA